jgi:hypothetical protein
MVDMARHEWIEPQSNLPGMMSRGKMSSMIRPVLRVILVLLVGIPLGLLVTIVLQPVWSWLEAAYGIESVGHSGPAEWCYLWFMPS